MQGTKAGRVTPGFGSAGQPFPRAKFYTHILESQTHPGHYYIGHTADLKARLAEHNRGKCLHTAKHAPWRIKSYFALQTEALARNFERYLKSGSGRAFAKRHFADDSST